MAYLLILAIVVFSFRLYMISSKEVVDTTQFTDYFQLDEADNGGLELTTSNFTTFEKEYNFVKEEKVEEDKKEGEKEKAKEKPAPPPPPPEDNDDGGRSAAYSGAGFAYPVRYAGVSSPFGNRYHPVLKRYILHTGVDLVAKYVPLRAAKAGVVTFAGNMSGYGKIIIIRHDNGYETRYAHLSVISTNVGEHVNQGDLIGKTGNSGRTTGAHLHFEIRQNGVPKNPMKYLH